MPFGRRFKDKYAGSSPENASVVRTLYDLFRGILPSLYDGVSVRMLLHTSTLPRKTMIERKIDTWKERYIERKIHRRIKK